MGRSDSYSQLDLGLLRDEISASAPDTALERLIDIAHDVAVGSPISAIVHNDDDRLGHTIAGTILRHQAFIARGGMIARMTSDERFEAYATIGSRAAYHLERAVSLAPEEPLSLGCLASLALEKDLDGKAEAETLLTRTPAAPSSAYSDVLQAWAYKWGGSQDDMWACLNRLWREDDPRSWAMVARATFEERLYTQAFKPAHEHYSAGVSARHGPISLKDASDLALLRPSDPENPGLMRFVHGWFGRVFWDAGDRRRAKRHLAETKNHMDPTIWVYGSVLLTARQRFGLAKLQSGLL